MSVGFDILFTIHKYLGYDDRKFMEKALPNSGLSQVHHKVEKKNIKCNKFIKSDHYGQYTMTLKTNNVHMGVVVSCADNHKMGYWNKNVDSLWNFRFQNLEYVTCYIYEIYIYYDEFNSRKRKIYREEVSYITKLNPLIEEEIQHSDNIEERIFYIHK